MPKIEIFENYKQAFLEKNLETFDQFMNLKSDKVFKSNQHRSVVKFYLWFQDHEADFFLKRHFQPELKDKIRDIIYFKWPLSDAKQELVNIQKVHSLGIATMQPVAWGEEDSSSLSQRSFLVTESLGNLERLEDYLVRQYTRPLSKDKIREKREFIAKVAELAKKFHGAGMVHRDFYCGHFLVKEQKNDLPILFLIDLQRVRQHSFLRRRWKTKDLAALNYTASPKGVSRTDRLRFFLHYSGEFKLNNGLKQWMRRIASKTSQMARHTDKKRRKYLQQKN